MLVKQLLGHFSVLGLLTCKNIKANQLLFLVASRPMDFIHYVYNLLRCILWQSSGTHQVCGLLWQVPGPTDAVLVLQQMYHQQLGYAAPRPRRHHEEGVAGLIQFSCLTVGFSGVEFHIPVQVSILASLEQYLDIHLT